MALTGFRRKASFNQYRRNKVKVKVTKILPNPVMEKQSEGEGDKNTPKPGHGHNPAMTKQTLSLALGSLHLTDFLQIQGP